LWPNRENESYAKAPWILKKKELDQLKNVIHSIRTPTGYGSSLVKAFIVGHITGFKTHNSHNFIYHHLYALIFYCVTKITNGLS
jgi:hypothetical protein